MSDYIDRDAVIADLCKALCGCEVWDCSFTLAEDGCEECLWNGLVGLIKDFKAADVVDGEKYRMVLDAARKMHEWIFLSCWDEEQVYAEIGLTDEVNALLGYGGSVEYRAKKISERLNQANERFAKAINEAITYETEGNQDGVEL